MAMFEAGLRRPAGVALVALCAASLAAALAPLGWPFELFAHFRWQLAAALAVLLPFAVLAGGRRLQALAAVTLVLQLAPLSWARDESRHVARDCAGPELRVATLNLWYRNADPTRVLQWLESHPVDVVVVQELTAAWQSALVPTAVQYPHRALHAREDAYGIGVLSRRPFATVETVDFAHDGLPSLAVTLDVDGRRVQVIGLHTRWPMLPHLRTARDAGLARAAERARRAAEPTVLAGDLNLTPYAPAFDRLERVSGLRDALAERWWRPSWQAGVWPLALPIDHVLVPRETCVVAAEVGPAVGSDHRPVRVTLRWP
jgi:endonuclease/exonuclease/phosphatase (EEP) superfamily protein YafD